jgi:peptidoglycan/LPS O-acetylase OafA/YrhL
VPRPTGSSSAYRPGLDGIRAIAVAGVIAYHLEAPWMPGGLLGVGVFFTLSGYLITSILVRTWERHGSMLLGRFWLARARRLLPAVFLMLMAVLTATALVATERLGDTAWQTLFAALYVANWGDILAGDSYFAATSGFGPLDHLWSLSIEEQFYLVWPLVLWALILVTRARRAVMGAVTLGLAAGSFIALALIATPSLDNTRAYEGTDTRAGALLMGAALALLWRGGIYAKAPSDVESPSARKAPWWLEAAGAAGLVCIVTLMATMPDHTIALYRWGLLALSIATAAVVAAAAHPFSVAGRALGVLPLRWLGERSYGIYLWHLPVIVFLPREVGGGSPWLRATTVIAITVALAALSWLVIEDPIRRHGFRAVLAWRPLRLLGDDAPAALRKVPVLAATGAVLGIGALTLSGAAAVPASTPPALASAVLEDKPGPLWGLPVDESLEAALLAPSEANASAGAEGKTSCTSVLHVGDSSSLGLIDERSLPDPNDRMLAQYSRVGVGETIMDVLGARSVVERYKGEPNAQDAVATALANGFEGCFVIAMGLNEAANVAVGGQASLADRIELIQALVGDAPTMWITVKTLRTGGPWANTNMTDMNQALYDACRRYPTMRVFDWASEAPDAWFSSDRIHFTPEGDKERAHRIADALAASFPATGPQGYQCRVESAWGAAPDAP